MTVVAPHPASAALVRWIDTHRDVIIAGLQRLIRIPTVSGGSTPAARDAFARGVREAFAWLVCEADRWGLRTRNYQGQALVIEAGEGHESVGVALHVDVVPPGEGWRHGDPFSGAHEEDHVWGRGAQDNKGPLMAALHALAALVAVGRPLRRRVQLIIGCQEEILVWDDVEAVLAREGAPLYSLVPDAVFPLVTAEKGVVNVVVAGRWERGEAPVRLDLLAGGEQVNIVPDHASAVLRFGAPQPRPEALFDRVRQFTEAHAGAEIEVEYPVGGDEECRITARGRRAHGSTPELGRNAIVDLLAFVVAEFGERLDAGTRAVLTQLLACSRDPWGSGWGLESSHAAVGPTTLSLDIVGVEPGHFRAWLNIRPTLGLGAAEVLARVCQRLETWDRPSGLRLGAEFEGRHFDPVQVDTARHAELIQATEEAFTAVTGRPAVHLSASGTTYMKVFPRSVGFGPIWREAEPELFHHVDERIPVAAHLRNVRLFAEALARLAL